jgi:hypothetical protein
MKTTATTVMLPTGVQPKINSENRNLSMIYKRSRTEIIFLQPVLVTTYLSPLKEPWHDEIFDLRFFSSNNSSQAADSTRIFGHSLPVYSTL